MVVLDGKNVLITGGAGFIGSHLCDRLLREPLARLVAMDNLFLGRERNLEEAVKDKRFIFEKGDVTDLTLIKKSISKYSVEVVFHLAVIPLEASLEKPLWCFDQNVKMTQSVCEAIRQSKRKITLIAFSSSEVYGQARYVPIDERHPLCGHTPYAASKIASDALVHSYHCTFGLDTALVRPFNNYGPRQNDGSYAGVIPLTIRRILSGEKPVVYGDGKQTRDFIFVKDTADAAVAIYKEEQSRGEAFNLASGRQITIEKVIKLICRQMEYTGEVEYQEERPGDVRILEGSIEKAKDIIGFEPGVKFEEGVKETVKWYVDDAKYGSPIP